MVSQLPLTRQAAIIRSRHSLPNRIPLLRQRAIDGNLNSARANTLAFIRCLSQEHNKLLSAGGEIVSKLCRHHWWSLQSKLELPLHQMKLDLLRRINETEFYAQEWTPLLINRSIESDDGYRTLQHQIQWFQWIIAGMTTMSGDDGRKKSLRYYIDSLPLEWSITRPPSQPMIRIESLLEKIIIFINSLRISDCAE